MAVLQQLPRKEFPVIAAEPAIDEVSAAVYVIPTDAPEARLLGLPLARQLGRIRDDVPVYGSGRFTSYDEQQTREQLTGWVERDRNPRVKIKIGEAWGTNVRRDLEQVALAREILGQDTELYVDANGAYTTGQAGTSSTSMTTSAPSS
jgi:L-alanine-DL-glutamate epimerase-like enolase superfamily enzyme